MGSFKQHLQRKTQIKTGEKEIPPDTQGFLKKKTKTV